MFSSCQLFSIIYICFGPCANILYMTSHRTAGGTLFKTGVEGYFQVNSHVYIGGEN